MPVIQIRSLPFKTPIDVSETIEGLMTDFARDTETSLAHVSAAWELMEAGSYGVAGQAVWNQPNDTHPVLVELLIPDFHSEPEIGNMLTCIAKSISARTGVHVNNIFVHHRRAHSGEVFDAGKIVRW